MSHGEITVQPLEVCGVTGAFTKGLGLLVLSVKEILRKFSHKDRGFAVVVLTHAPHVPVVGAGKNELVS